MIARTWVAAGHDVEVITAIPDPMPWTESYEVTRTWSLRSLLTAARRSDLVAVNGYSRLAISAAALGQRRPIVFHQGYQLICSDGLGFRGRQFHGFDPRKDLKLAFKASVRDGLRAVGRLPFDATVKGLSKAIEHVVPSRHVGQRLGLPRYRVVYQPPNPAVIEAIAARGELTADDRTRAYETGDIVFFGRLVFEKGCDDLIRAYQLWRRTGGGELRGRRIPRLILFGRGPELQLLEDLVTSLGIDKGDVDLRPFVSGRELAHAASSASVVVVPSRWEEPGATVGVELFACGAAVIASETGALGEIFEGQGRLFKNGDVEGLARALGAHFSDGPIYPRPTGREPWLVPAIKRDLLALLEPAPDHAR